MEIQDRNNLLQQLFLAKAENTVVANVAEKGFADMLKLQEATPDFSAEEKPSVDFRRDDYIKADRSVKKESALETKSNSVAKQDKTAKKDKTEPKKENTSGADNASNNNEVKDSPSKDKADNKSDTALSAKEDASKTADEAKTDKKGEVAGENIAADSQSADSDVSAVAKVIENTALLPGIASVNYANTEDAFSGLSAENMLVSEDVAADVPTDKADLAATALLDDAKLVQDSEDALLMEQIKYLDKKIASPDKIKISVDVVEDKVEAQVTKDVLQNRFDIDSVLQQADSSEVSLLDEAPLEVALPKEDGQLKAKSPVEQMFNPAAYKGTAVQDAQVVKEAAVNHLTNASNLAVSGKEVVFETSNNLRSETFARLNESSNRDVFKGMGKEVVEQVKVNITKSAIKGVDTIDIQLKPEDLGKIQIKMHIAKDGKLHADIISSRPETMDLLQKDISGLQKAFNDAGYDTDSRSFNFSFQKENQAREGQDGNSGLMQFIGDALEQEAQEIAGNDNLEYDPVLGLNIRV